MKMQIAVFNLWFYFVAGYLIMTVAMMIADHMRGKPIEDRDLYRHCGPGLAARGMLPLLLFLLVSLFVPVRTWSLQYWSGLVLATMGELLSIAVMFSFTARGAEGLNRKGFYAYSRNPMYLGAFVFLTGLNMMSFDMTILYAALGVTTILVMAAYHSVVIGEESFLKSKYGEQYESFCKKVPRYIGFVRVR